MKQEDVENEFTEQPFFLQRLVAAFIRKLKRERREARKDAEIDFLSSQLNKEPQGIPIKNIIKVIKDELKD